MMPRQQIRVKSVDTSFRSVEPKYAASLVVFEVDGIEVPISVPLQQGKGVPGGHVACPALPGCLPVPGTTKACRDAWPGGIGGHFVRE